MSLPAGLQDLADRALSRWVETVGGRALLLSLSENAVYRVTAPGRPDCVLRIHREDYHSRNAIGSELAWMQAIRDEAGILTPVPIPDRDGQLVVRGCSPRLPRPRNLVLFRWIEGRAPEEGEDLAAPFEGLGAVTARLHAQAAGWIRPAGFERHRWDAATILGARPLWGDWRAGPELDPPARRLLGRAEAVLCRRLQEFGTGPERFGLVHADLRLANLLLHEGDTRVIDFDDCGFGWHLYDLATALSFLETDPRTPALITAWLRGYTRLRPLAPADRREIPTFLLLRRMALLAWIGSHAETDLARQQAPGFAAATCELAEGYLAGCG